MITYFLILFPDLLKCIQLECCHVYNIKSCFKSLECGDALPSIQLMKGSYVPGLCSMPRQQIRQPLLFKRSFYASSILRKLQLAFVSLHRKKKSKEHFHFYKKGEKLTLHSGFVLQEPSWRQHSPQQEGGTAKLLSWNHTQYRHPATSTVGHIPEHQCFISLHFVHTLARCFLQYVKDKCSSFKELTIS